MLVNKAYLILPALYIDSAGIIHGKNYPGGATFSLVTACSDICTDNVSSKSETFNLELTTAFCFKPCKVGEIYSTVFSLYYRNDPKFSDR